MYDFVIVGGPPETGEALASSPDQVGAGAHHLSMTYDLVIVGGGPGGVAAGVYAARKKIKTVLVTDTFGGQSLVSADVQNWIGTKSVSGFDLGRMLEEHLRAQEDIEIIDGEMVTLVQKKNGGFTVATQSGKVLETKYLLISSGSRRRKLGVPGERELDGKGVAYCSTCDAPIFKNKTVAVIGGGNAGLEAVVDSLAYASKIYLLERGEKLRGDPVTQVKVVNHPKVDVIMNAQTQEILGEKFVTGFRYLDLKTNQSKELKVEGVFVEVGSLPNTEFLGGLVKTNAFGEILVDHKTQRTSEAGVWAIGDVTDVLYKQNNISAGDAVKAILNIFEVMNRT